MVSAAGSAVAKEARVPSEDALCKAIETLARKLHPNIEIRIRVGMDTTLDRDLGLDSLSRVELLTRIEREFGASMSERDMAEAQTPRDILRALRSRAAIKAGARPVAPAPAADSLKAGAEDLSEAPGDAETLIEALLWHIRSHPQRTHVHLLDDDAGQQRLSYGELLSQSQAFAAGFRRQGLEPGQAVAIMLPTGADYFFSFFGVLLAGGIPVPLYPPARITQIEDHFRRHARILANARATMLVTFDQVKRVTRLLASQVEGLRTIVTPDELQGHGTLTEIYSAGADHIAFLQYTSGSTGDPKGVMLTHANLLYGSRASMQIRAMHDRDRVYGVLPFTHIFAFNSAFLAALRAGATLQLATRFEPAAFFTALADGVSVIPAVPAMYAKLLEFAERNGIETPEIPALRYISAGGAPLDPDWKRRVERFFGISLHNGYGMTESTAGICATRVGDERDDLSAGPAMPEQDVRVVPAPGKTALDDGVGEIVVKGPNVMLGYYRNAQETARVIDEDGYLHTGDLGRFDEHGYLYVLGRCKELIIRSGFNVYPPEVEAAINEHRDVVHAAVIGRPERDGNETVLAFVERAPGTRVDETALQTFVSGQLAPYKRPARIVVTDALPLSAAGKVLKYRLLDLFAEQLAR